MMAVECNVRISIGDYKRTSLKRNKSILYSSIAMQISSDQNINEERGHKSGKDRFAGGRATAENCEKLETPPHANDRLVRLTLSNKWDQHREAMKMFPYFDSWNDDDVSECCVLSKIKRYEPDQIILGNCNGKQNSVYFILKGQCQMVQHMELAVCQINGCRNFRLLSKDCLLRPTEQLKIHFMQVCLMNKGECFNIGENLEKRSIITTTEVECLLCPYHWLMQNSKANIWDKIKHFLDMYLPTKEQLFNEFLKQRSWLHYREGLVRNNLKKCNRQSSTMIYDVPYSIRIKEGIKLPSK